MTTLFLAEFSLKHAAIEMVDELEGICAACYFKSGSNAGGCAIEIHNDETGTFFNISHVDENVSLWQKQECSVYRSTRYGAMGHWAMRSLDFQI